MKINVKNYTSQVPVTTSVARIEEMLVDFGADNILKGYREKALASIQFTLIINDNSSIFKIKAYPDIIEELLIAEYVRPTNKSYKQAGLQADRTAWKIVHDWVQIQLTMVRLEQMPIEEAFMTKMLNPKTGQVFFDVMKNDGFKLLGK